MKKCVTYARVSTDNQRDTGFSIPAQAQLFREYATSRGLEVVREYQESESAKAAGRKLFSEMLAFVKKNRIQAVVFEKVDRMTRNFSDLITIYDLIEKHGIEIHLIKNNLVLTNESRSSEKFQLDIQVVIARNYIENLIEETKKGMTARLAAGWWNAKPPLGYRPALRDGRRIIEVEPSGAAVVSQIFELAVVGMSAARIAEELAARGHIVHRNTVFKIIHNEFYIGILNTSAGVFPGKHETFISPGVFEVANERIRGKRKNDDAVDRVFRFSGLIRCSCGYGVYGELKKGRYVTYGCGRRRISERQCGAKPRYVSELKIIAQIRDVVKRISLTDTECREIQALIRQMFEQFNQDSDRRMNQAHVEIQRKKARFGKLLDHYENGIFTKDEYLEEKERLHRDILRLQAEHEANTTTPMVSRTSFSQLFPALVSLHEYLFSVRDVGDFQKIMKLIFSKLEIQAGKVRFELTKLGTTLYERRENTAWLPHGGRLTILSELFWDWHRRAA